MATEIGNQLLARVRDEMGRNIATIKRQLIEWLERPEAGGIDILRDKLFPKPKEPEYRVVEDYYGRDVIVPPQARWIAMDINGSTYTYETAPVMRVGCWRENINGEEEHIPVSWYPPEVAWQHWQDSLREVQP